MEARGSPKKAIMPIMVLQERLLGQLDICQKLLGEAFSQGEEAAQYEEAQR